MSHYFHLHTKLSITFLLICIYQDLLGKSHRLEFFANYFVNKHLGCLRNNFPKTIKDGGYVVIIDKYKSIGTYWIPPYVMVTV